MASNTCSMKPVKRSAGRSATAAAAYRAGEEVTDQRTGEVHDYTRKNGIVSAQIIAPAGAPAWAHDRDALWNHAEQTETRGNARVAREFVIGLPHELSDDQRQILAHEFAQSLVDRYGFAADVCIHRPDRDGDQRNHHAHILCTTREMGPEGLGKKTRALDDRKQGPEETKWFRQDFEARTNAALEAANIVERVDMRSFKDQGLDFEPTQHMGPAATAMERKNPGSTRIGQENRARQERNLEREIEHQDIEEATRDLGTWEALDEYLEGEAAYLQSVIDHERRQEAIAMAADDQDQATEHERPTRGLGSSWLASPEPEPQPSPAAAKPPRQPEKPKKPPTDEKLSAGIGKIMDEQPVPPADGTIWEGRSLEGWLRERWDTVTERAKNMAESVRERLRPLFDREATTRAEEAGYRRESIENAGLEPTGPDPAEEARKKAELLRERSLMAERMSNEQQRIVNPNDLVIDQETGEWREGTEREKIEQWEPENPDKLTLLDKRMLEEQRRLEQEPPEPEPEKGPSLG